MKIQKALFTAFASIALAGLVACGSGSAKAPAAQQTGPDDQSNVPTEQSDVPVDPITGEPVEQTLSAAVVDKYGFKLTIPASAKVTQNGFVTTCEADQPDEPVVEPPPPPVVADAGAPPSPPPVVTPPPPPPPPPAADAGAPVVLKAAGNCRQEYQLKFEGFVDWPVNGESISHPYDLRITINPVDNGHLPTVIVESTEDAHGGIVIAHNINDDGVNDGSDWAYDATELQASNGSFFQFQLNAQQPDVMRLKMTLQELLADFRVVPISP